MSSKEFPAAPQRVDIDYILREEVGQLGRYQLRTLALLAIVIIFIGWANSEYIFTTARVNTRCFIPECESAGDTTFSPPWLQWAVPSSGDAPDGCSRFAAANSSDGTANCSAALFDSNIVVPCDQYVYENTNTVVHDLGLACSEWRRALVGSVRTAGIMVGLPLCGLLSDRWGRRTLLAMTALNTSVLGALRSLASSYGGFLAAHFAEGMLGSGTYTCAFIICMEIIGPKYRSISSVTTNTFFALGQASTSLLAWLLLQWRLLTLAVFLPQLISVGYFWVLPESTRWLFAKGKEEQAIRNLKNIARVNGRKLNDKTLEALKETLEEEKRKAAELSQEPWLVVSVWRCRPVFWRCVLAPLWWVSFTCIYYGLTINSVNIAGNSYVNFVAVALVEVPGFWLAFLLMNSAGRKPVLAGGFWLCAACQLAYLFISEDLWALSLTVYLVGKCSIALVVVTTYTYTAELFPTACRHRLLAYCSMLGRLGAIAAPFTPALGARVPFMLFGALALVAGALALLPPETKGTALPDSLRDVTTTNNKVNNKL